MCNIALWLSFPETMELDRTNTRLGRYLGVKHGVGLCQVRGGKSDRVCGSCCISCDTSTPVVPFEHVSHDFCTRVFPVAVDLQHRAALGAAFDVIPHMGNALHRLQSVFKRQPSSMVLLYAALARKVMRICSICTVSSCTAFEPPASCHRCI